MGKSIQKKIKFSKGEISPYLIERTDLATYDSSAQKIKNCVSTIYGGVRTRKGSKFLTVFGDMESLTVSSSLENYENHDDFFNGYGWKSKPIGNNRTVFIMSVNKNESGGSLLISGISSKINDEGIEVYRSVNSGNFSAGNLYNGVYKIKMSGGGGGSLSSFVFESLSHYEWHASTGGSGAGVDADFYINGSLSGYIGNGKSDDNTIAGSSYISVNGEICINMGAGESAVPGDDPSSPGVGSIYGCGGKITYNDSLLKRYGTRGFLSDGKDGKTLSIIYRPSYSVSGSGLFLKDEDSSIRKIGSSGDVYYSISPTPVETYSVDSTSETSMYSNQNINQVSDGNDGGIVVNCIFSYIPVIVMSSIDGISYEELYKTTLSDISISPYIRIPENHKWIKLVVDVDESYSLNCGISIDSISFWSNSMEESNFKMIDFVYNNDQKYLLILSNEKITIFSNGTIQTVVNASGLLSQYIPTIKYASKDDLIVFTHQDMHTKTLKRTNTGWEWSDFEYQNIPYYAFNGETKTEQTIGITPSGLEGSLKITADSSVFDETWVGQRIDGNGGVLRITEYISSTEVNGVTIIPFYTEDKITQWTKISGYEQVWSEENGYPTSCIFAQQRLWFGGSKKLPSNIWSSRINDYYNFKNAGNYSNDAINVSLLTNNRIYNMVENRGLHIFTAGEEWTAPEGGFTPDGFSCSINTRNGSIQNITPVIIGGIIVFVEKNGNSILSYVYDYNQASYTSDDLSVFTNLVKKPISMSVLSNSSRDKGDFMYLVLEDGTMLVVCVSFQQKIFSVSEYETKGQVKDVCCVGEDVYIIVYRNGLYSLEIISDDKTDMTTKIYVSGDTISNISLYNNNYVYIYNDNEVYGKYLVEDGSIKLNKDIETYLNIGIPYDYLIESNPIAINNQTITKKKRIAKAVVYCEDTNKISFCGQEKTGDNIFSFYACTSYQKDVRFNISGEFYPVNVLSVTLNLNYED